MTALAERDSRCGYSEKDSFRHDTPSHKLHHRGVGQLAKQLPDFFQLAGDASGYRLRTAKLAIQTQT
jgi:hypothetical protein